MKCRHFAANLRFFYCVQGLFVGSEIQPTRAEKGTTAEDYRPRYLLG